MACMLATAWRDGQRHCRQLRAIGRADAQAVQGLLAGEPVVLTSSEVGEPGGYDQLLGRAAQTARQTARRRAGRLAGPEMEVFPGLSRSGR
jgi:broad specificity phosphatase PhoE